MGYLEEPDYAEVNDEASNAVSSAEIQSYLRAKDENTRINMTLRYPAIHVARCPADLYFAYLPGLYNILSISLTENNGISEGRVFFACPASRQRFLADWHTKYAKVWPEVRVYPLGEYMNKTSWLLPIQRYTYPVKSAYVMFNGLSYAFDDLRSGDIQSTEITVVKTEDWLYSATNQLTPHFFAVSDTQRRNSIEEIIAAESLEPVSEIPGVGCGVIVTQGTKRRGVVVSRRIKHARVFLIDYGTAEDFPDTDLVPAPRTILEYSFCAVPCQLRLSKGLTYPNGTLPPIDDLLDAAKKQDDIVIVKVGYRGSINIVDAFEASDVGFERSIVPVLVNKATEPMCVPAVRRYTVREFKALKTGARIDAFRHAIDPLTGLEAVNLFRKKLVAK